MNTHIIPRTNRELHYRAEYTRLYTNRSDPEMLWELDSAFFLANMIRLQRRPLCGHGLAGVCPACIAEDMDTSAGAVGVVWGVQ